jgi:hypothetical protein
VGLGVGCALQSGLRGCGSWVAAVLPVLVLESGYLVTWLTTLPTRLEEIFDTAVWMWSDIDEEDVELYNMRYTENGLNRRQAPGSALPWRARVIQSLQ